MSKLAKMRSRRRTKKNPSEATELGYNIAAGFAGYGVTRFLSRAVYSQVVKKRPQLAEHAYVVAAAVGAAGAYFGSKKWAKVADYHEAISIGAGIALLQTAVQTYIPKFGWIVGDVSASQYVKAAAKPAAIANLDLGAALGEYEEDLGSVAAELGEVEAYSSGSETDFDLDSFLADNDDVEAIPLSLPEAAEASVH